MAIVFAILPFVADQLMWVLPLFFIFGVGTGMIYLSITTWMNNRFQNAALTSANTVAMITGNLGGMIGAFVAGQLMQWNTDGLPLLIILMLILFFSFSFWSNAVTPRHIKNQMFNINF